MQKKSCYSSFFAVKNVPETNFIPSNIINTTQSIIQTNLFLHLHNQYFLLCTHNKAKTNISMMVSSSLCLSVLSLKFVSAVLALLVLLCGKKTQWKIVSQGAHVRSQS